MNSSTKPQIFGSLTIRLVLSLVIFAISNLIYPSVFETVGYMYQINLEPSYFNAVIGGGLLFLLIAASQFKNQILRHGFDICVLGVFLPIAVISTQISSHSYYMLFPFFSIIVMIYTVKVLEGTKLIKSMNNQKWGGLPFSQLKLIIFIPYLVVLCILLLNNRSGFNLNLIEVYFNAYEIRAENNAGGMLGYFIGWFVILFIPLFLSKNKEPFHLSAPFLLFLGVFYLFETFALKVVFLNFFLIALFSYFQQMKAFSYFPHYFFLTIFIITYAIGMPLHPLLDRFFYLVGLNSIFYIDYFSTHPLRYFEGTKLDLGISNYGLEVGYLIDNAYYQGLGTNQSAGFLPTMFSDLGLFGVLFYSMLIGGLISVIKSMQSSSESYSYLVMVAFVFSLMNHPINMLFLSNGLIFVVIFAFILRRGKSVHQATGI